MEPNNRFAARDILFCFVLLLLLASGCGLHRDVGHPRDWDKFATVRSPEWSDGRARQLEEIVRKYCVPYITNGQSVGLSVAVVSGTNKTVMGFGRTCVTNEVLAKDDTVYEIGSITKTFTSLALAREIERGTVRLEQPVAELMPSGVEISKEARAVTFRELTTHTSGLPSLPDNMSVLHGFRKLMSGGNPYENYTEEQFREAIRTIKLTSKPGTHFEYSNFGMDLLGYVLSQKAGMTYEAYIKREVCEPLGMFDTTVTLTTNQAARFAQGYLFSQRRGTKLEAWRSSPWDLPSYLAGSGALRSTASDLLKYLEAQMHPMGPLATAIQESHVKLYKEPKVVAIGMNWIRSPLKGSGQVIWHNGGMGGAHSFLAFTEDGKVGVVLLANVGESVDELGWKILRDLIKRTSTQEKIQPNK